MGYSHELVLKNAMAATSSTKVTAIFKELIWSQLINQSTSHLFLNF